MSYTNSIPDNSDVRVRVRVMGYGLWVKVRAIDYGLWVMGYGLGLWVRVRVDYVYYVSAFELFRRALLC
jgi:hypothetical protein